MHLKYLNNLFDDDFSEANMEIDDIENSQESTSTLLRTLEDDETSIEKRLESVQKLVIKFVPKTALIDIEKKILQYLMPSVKDLLSDVFEICQTLSSSDTEEKSSRTLNRLQEYLQMCIVIHEELDCILDYIIQNEQINLCQIQSLPLNVVHILRITFQHCKQSGKLYKDYFDDLKEILLSLFKAAQDVHAKLLKLLDNRTIFDSGLEEQFMLLKDVLEVIGEIGEILVDTSVKCLADNWKGYMALAQKLADVLNGNCFIISRPLAFFGAEISRNLNAVLKMDSADQKSATQTLKISSFFARVVLKLCEIFCPSLERTRVSVLDFFSSLYNFYPPFLKFKGYLENVVDQINSLIFACIEQLLDKLLCEPEFVKAFSELEIKKAPSPGLLFLLVIVLQKLPTLIRNNKFTGMPCSLYPLVDLFFRAIKKSYCELFWKIKIPIANDRRPLYDESVMNLSLIILSLTKEEYDEIQLILFRNVLQGHIWGALLATDVWCLILRKKPPRLCYETLCQVIMKTESLLLNNFINRPEEVFLENLLRRLYAILPEDFRSKIVEKYPPSVNLHIWKILGFNDFPRTQIFMIESLLINFMEKVEGFKRGKCSVNDFNFMCNGFEAISSLSEENGINFKYLLSVLVKVWDFEPDGGLYDNALFRLFMKKLCAATKNFVLLFDNEQLLVILMKLKQLLDACFDIKIQGLQILHSLSIKKLAPSPEQTQIMMILSEVFRTLLQDKNPIIRQAILEVFLDFLNATPHEEIVQNAVRNHTELKRIISNFIQRNIDPKGPMSGDEYFSNQKTYRFQHVCPNLPTGQKRIKTEHNEVDLVVKNSMSVQNKNKIDQDELYTLVKRIKSDVKSLHKLCGKENVTEENVTEIVNILSRQIGYKI